jgi:NAD(P)-dependent dehydrogenase (short-subunit alcohol dehydrogenase family)
MEPSNESLGGRVALVTGGGLGIGRAVAVGLAAAALVSWLPGDDTGQIWNASDLLPAGDHR